MQKAITYLSKKEIIFNEIIKQYGLPKIPFRPQGFETLVLLILEQQVSIDSAKATYLKIKAKEKTLLPTSLLNLSDEEFRNFGVSRQKTTYIKALATAILEEKINLENLASKPSLEVRDELIKIKGIGHWTIDIYLMFCLQEQDLIPLGDIAVVNTMKELFDVHTKEEMEQLSMQWRPYRSMATFLLWHYYLQKRGRNVNY